MKVLVIPEDPRLDQYILKPVVERIFADLRKSPRVTVLSNPRLRGVAEALNRDILADIVATYPMNNLFLVIVDRSMSKNASRSRSSKRRHPSSIPAKAGLGPCGTWGATGAACSAAAPRSRS